MSFRGQPFCCDVLYHLNMVDITLTRETKRTYHPGLFCLGGQFMTFQHQHGTLTFNELYENILITCTVLSSVPSVSILQSDLGKK